MLGASQHPKITTNQSKEHATDQAAGSTHHKVEKKPMPNLPYGAQQRKYVALSLLSTTYVTLSALSTIPC